MTSPYCKGVRERVRPSIPLFVVLLATLAKSVGIGDCVSSIARSSFYSFLFYFIYLVSFENIKWKMIYYNLSALCYINVQIDLNICCSHMTIIGTSTQ